MPSIALTGLVLFLAAALQGAVGFAVALFGIPLLLWVGCTLPVAIALILTTSITQSLSCAWKLSEQLDWKQILPATGFRLVGLPLGLVALVYIDSLDTDLVRQTVGVTLLVLVAAQALYGDRETILTRSRPLSFLSSGFLLGSVGMGGPPAVLWVTGRDWSAAEMRAFMFGLNILTVPVSLALLGFRFGQETVVAIGYGVLFCPLAVVGGLVGLRIGNLMERSQLRTVAFALLALLGLSSLY